MTRSLLALFLAATALASCKNPPPIDHWIVGRWEMDMSSRYGPTMRNYMRNVRPDMSDAEIDAIISSGEAQSREEGATPTMTLEADGTGSMAGSPRGEPIVDPFRWELVESSPSTVSIETWRKERPERMRIVFNVESTRAIAYAEGPDRGIRLVRVP